MASELTAGAGEAIEPGPASDGMPLLRATPMRLAFPPTRAGDVSETRTVLVTNATAAPLALVDAIAHGAQGDAFQVVGIDDTWLAPGAGTRLHVVFRPGASGTHRGFCTVETEDGLGLSIPLLGRGRPSLAADLAGGDPAARAEALDRIDAGLRAELARQAASGAPIALGPTYREMELAFELAVEAARDGHTARARALAEALQAVFAQVASRDRVTAVFQERDIALQAPIAMWAFASDAVRDLAVRVGSDRLPPAVGAELLARFRVGRAVIELATGESRDASTFDEFDRASLLTTGVVSALPLAAIVVVAAPEVVGAAWARLAPTLVSEAGTLWFATRTLWAGLRVLINGNPAVAMAWAELVVPLLVDLGENWDHRDEYLDRLKTREGFTDLALQMLLGLLEVQNVRGGRPDLDGDGDGAGPWPRRGGLPDGDGGEPRPPLRPRLEDEPTLRELLAESPRELPPPIAKHVDAAPPGAAARGAWQVRAVLDRLAALADAMQRATPVPRGRSSAVMAGDEPAPLTAAADAEPVLDHGTTFGERYDHARHQRRAAHAARDGALYEGAVAEGAITGRDLRARGAREVERLDDALMGDAMITYELPNRHRVTVRERGAAPPRIQAPRDPARARALQADAEAARTANAARAAATDAALEASLVADPAGLHVDRVFDRVIVGGGPTAVELYATRPEGAAARARAVEAPGDLDLSTLVIADGDGDLSWSGRPIDTGQPSHETASVPLDHAPRELVDAPVRFLPAAALADAAALTARNHAMPVWRGHRAVRIDATPDATWRHPAAARRIWVRDAGGREVAVYARTLDLAGGLGAPRALEPERFGPASDPAAQARNRAALEDTGVLVSAESHLATGTPAGATRVLVSGGGATAPWNARLVTDASPGAAITWISRGGTRSAAARAEMARVDAAVATAQAELADVELHLARRAPDAEDLLARRAAIADELRFLAQRRADLEHAGDAMQLRNLGPDDAFGMANVRRVAAEIAAIEPVVIDGATKARVTLSTGEVAVYDQVIVNHGADPRTEGSTASLVAGERLAVVPTGQRAHIASTDGAVRVFGAASFTVAGRAAPTPRDPQSDADGRRETTYNQTAGFETQPAVSRGVPSFYLAGEQVREANR